MREDILALRVAARFQREVAAAFIPDKWFKTKKAELNALLKVPLNTSGSRMWTYRIDERFGEFFTNFEKDFQQIVTFEPAIESVQRRVKSAKDNIRSIVDNLEPVCSYAEHINFKDPAQYLTWKASSQILEKILVTAKTYTGLLKWAWSIDEAMVDRLVKRTLKAANPEQLASLTADYDSISSTLRFRFLSDLKFDEAAVKALKRTKLNWDITSFVDSIYDTLKFNYSEEIVQDEGLYRNFDMYGIKIIIDDLTVTSTNIKHYVDFIDKAHTALKSKGFEKAWYGTIFIKCEECGGENQNTGGGVGGHYHIGPDTVTLYERPSWHTLTAIVHELGHRYWYKQMTQTQRARFSDLIKTRTVHRPWKKFDMDEFKLIGEKELRVPRDKINEEEKNGKWNLNRVRNLDFPKASAAAKDNIAKALWSVEGLIVDYIEAIPFGKDLGPEASSLKADVHAAKRKFGDRASDLPSLAPGDVNKWLEEVDQALDEYVANALIYVDFAAHEFNKKIQEKIDSDPEVKEWLESYEKNPNPVTPVSDYGKSNVSEAFAEVFTHYVLEYEMNRDQLESFKSVFSSVDDPIVNLVVRGYSELVGL